MSTLRPCYTEEADSISHSHTTDAKSHMCTVCDKQFTRRCALNNHIQLSHMNITNDADESCIRTMGGTERNSGNKKCEKSLKPEAKSRKDGLRISRTGIPDRFNMFTLSPGRLVQYYLSRGLHRKLLVGLFQQ